MFNIKKMQRQQNQIRAQQRLHQTLSETTDIINEGYANRSATFDRMSRKSSETIRGVNTYETTYGNTIESSVRYDNVYQNGTTFIGSKDGSLKLGP